MNLPLPENSCSFIGQYEDEGVQKNIYYHSKCDSEYHIVLQDTEQHIICQRCNFYDKHINKDTLAREKLDKASNSKYLYRGIAYKDNKAAITVMNQETGNFFLNNNLDNLTNKNNNDPYLRMNKYEKIFFDFISSCGINTDPFKILSIKQNEKIRISKNSQPYRVDFSINLLNQPVLAIEIDGPHHHKQMKMYDSYASLAERISRDLNKDAYLSRNFIPLLRLTPCNLLKIKLHSENIVNINGENFVAKVIGHQQIIERNFNFLLNSALEIDNNSSSSFSTFISNLQEISPRTNPFQY